MKKPSDSRLNKNLDTHWSKLVKNQAGNKCEVCGSTQNLNSHHGVCLCVKHHKWGNVSAHENPLWFDEWLRENRSEDYEAVKTVMNEIKKWNYWEKEELLQEFKLMLKEK